MSRRRRKSGTQSTRPQEAALSVLALGAAVLLAPLMIHNPVFAGMLAALRPLGWLLLAAGGVLLWLALRGTRAAQPARPAPAPAMPVETAKQAAPETPAAEASPPPSRPTAWSAAVFEVIEWRRFEAVVEALFRQAGFETRAQSHGADGGVDVWLHSRSVPDRAVSVVQCKHWQGKRVGVDKIRELRGVMAAHDVKRGQFATTSTFTPDAVAFARENSINLLDVDALLALIAQRTPEQQQALLDIALEGDYWRPTCVNCGLKLVERAAKNGGSRFWGCTAFPKYRTTMAMRAG
ncbi:MAG: restriction endonuclease [Roseateles sp.]